MSGSCAANLDDRWDRPWRELNAETTLNVWLESALFRVARGRSVVSGNSRWISSARLKALSLRHRLDNRSRLELQKYPSFE